MKKLTCGIIVITNQNKILLGHSTGNSHWDIFKGICGEDETSLEAALRETEEESGLKLFEKDVIFIGEYNFNKYKNIALYLHFIESLDLEKLNCTSMVVIDDKKPFPELDVFQTFDFNDGLEKMSKSLRNLFERKKIYENILRYKLQNK